MLDPSPPPKTTRVHLKGHVCATLALFVNGLMKKSKDLRWAVDGTNVLHSSTERVPALWLCSRFVFPSVSPSVTFHLLPLCVLHSYCSCPIALVTSNVAPELARD